MATVEDLAALRAEVATLKRELGEARQAHASLLPRLDRLEHLLQTLSSSNPAATPLEQQRASPASADMVVRNGGPSPPRDAAPTIVAEDLLRLASGVGASDEPHARATVGARAHPFAPAPPRPQQPAAPPQALPSAQPIVPYALPPPIAGGFQGMLQLDPKSQVQPEYYVREVGGASLARITDADGAGLVVRLLSLDGSPAPKSVVDGVVITVHLERSNEGVRGRVWGGCSNGKGCWRLTFRALLPPLTFSPRPRRNLMATRWPQPHLTGRRCCPETGP
jgi:hypothetical protein